MDSLLTRKVRPLQRRSRRKPLSEEIQSVYRLLSITLIALGLMSTGSYLYMNSLKPAKGYELKQLQTDYESLQSQQRKLERQVIEAQSFMTIESQPLLNEMEVINKDQVSYTEEDTGLAQNLQD